MISSYLVTAAITGLQGHIHTTVEEIRLILKWPSNITLSWRKPGFWFVTLQSRNMDLKLISHGRPPQKWEITSNWSLWPRVEKYHEKENLITDWLLFEATAPYLHNPRLVLKFLESINFWKWSRTQTLHRQVWGDEESRNGIHHHLGKVGSEYERSKHSLLPASFNW